MSKEINEFKLDVIEAFAGNPDSEVTPTLLIQTSNGTINGKLTVKDDLPEVYDEEGNFIGDTDKPDIYFAAVRSLLKIFREQRTSEAHKDDNNSFVKGIWLKDVKIFMPNQSLPLEVPHYFLFLDQVVGVTIGDLKAGNL